MSPRTLDDWLQHWLAQHPREIVMGLERVRRVWAALGAPQVAPTVFMVAGTNGKGSTVAFIDAMLRAGGYRVGRYTSPHLLRYNERIAIDGGDLGDAQLIQAFADIDAARGDTALTYFEAGTLAALLLFSRADLDAAILEVGLGGRLDAVNIVDADVAIVTSIGLDHQDLLGDTLDDIGREKAGIARNGRPVVVAMPDPPQGLLQVLAERGAVMLRAGRDYHWQAPLHAPTCTWQLTLGTQTLELPLPALAAPVQLRNAAAAIVALHQCRGHLPLDTAALATGLATARPGGRLQVIGQQPQIVLDVAHNPEAAAALVEWLALYPRRTRAVFSALADKDATAIVRVIEPHIVHWHVCGLTAQTPRGATAQALLTRLCDRLPSLPATAHDTPEAALAAAIAASSEDERILVFGSFYLIAALMPGGTPLAVHSTGVGRNPDVADGKPETPAPPV